MALVKPVKDKYLVSSKKINIDNSILSSKSYN